ncbi:hypothetical protein niasHT_007322 [Heterodera trifolii]|uniref:Uncharacterized protein n=1 Tax=Heterodera trifolii TaxID=157864 RepID=A0ABD2LM96_9BILA
MCELRSAFFKPLNLETIEEEVDVLSQNSRVNLRNGGNRRSGVYSRPLSQTNTITTYDTQHDLYLDVNNMNTGNRVSGSLRFSTLQSMRSALGIAIGVDKGSTITTNKSRRSSDKWESNYYYNDYEPTDPMDIYLTNNPPKTPKRTNENSSSTMSNCFGWLWFGSSVRFFILLLSFLSLASLFANIQLFNLVALYAQNDLLPQFLQCQSPVVPKSVWTPPPIGNASVLVRKQQEEQSLLDAVRIGDATDVLLETNGTEKPIPPKVEKGAIEVVSPFDRLVQSFSFSVPGVGILLGHFPSVFLIRRITAHKTIFVALILSGAVTAAFPFSINSGSLCVFLSRALLGLSFSPAFAFVGVFAANWATLSEQLLFILSVFLAVQFGPLLSWLSSLSLLSVDNHNSRVLLFGLHSAVSTFLAILWLIFYRDNPQKYALVNGEEIARITRGKSIRRSVRPRLPRPLPFLLFRSASAWACWLSSFCYFFVVLSLHIFLPVFTFKMLHQFVGLSIVLPFVILMVSHLFFYLVSPLFGDSSSWKVRLFNSLGFLGSAMVFLTVTILPRDHFYEYRCSLLLRLSLLPLGFCSVGFIKSLSVCGRLFTQHIVAHIQFAFGFAYFIVPTMVFMMGAESPTVNWRLLFLCCALVLLIGLAFFVIFGSGVPTGWANQWADEAKEKDSLLMVKFTKTPFE